MKISRRGLLKGAAALGVAGTLPQVSPFSAQAQGTQKRELIVAQGGDISKFDPHFSTSSNDIRWSFNIFDNLTARHADGPGRGDRAGKARERVRPARQR